MSLVLLAHREFFVLQAETERQRDTGDDATEALTAGDAATMAAFFAALAVGGAWSLTYLTAVGCWLATGRGPGGRLLASGVGSANAGRHGLRTLATQHGAAREVRRRPSATPRPRPQPSNDRT